MTTGVNARTFERVRGLASANTRLRAGVVVFEDIDPLVWQTTTVRAAHRQGQRAIPWLVIAVQTPYR